MQILGTTRVFMVLGDPIAQVQAPQVFNALFRRHGVDAVLVPAHVRPPQFGDFVRHVMTASNIDGLWLTIPHKPAGLEVVTHCHRAGRLAGAVNAVRRRADGALEGALFDGEGFVKALRHHGFEPAGRRALLVGAGGAGAAIAVALVDAGVATLVLHDLGDRADVLAARLAQGSAEGSTTLVVADSADPAGFDLVINATPLGLRPGDPLPFDAARLDAGATVVDILMKHAPTPLLQACRARGVTAHPGFEMLVQQVPDYLDFFGLHDTAMAVREDLADVRERMSAP